MTLISFPFFFFFLFSWKLLWLCLFVHLPFNRKTYFLTSSVRHLCCMQWWLTRVLDMLFTHCDQAQTLASLHTERMRKNGSLMQEEVSLTQGGNFPVQWVWGSGRGAHGMAIARQTGGPVHSLVKSWFAVALPKCQNIELHDICVNSNIKSLEIYISLEF